MPYVNQLRWFFLHFMAMNTFFCRCSNNKNKELKKNKMLINVWKKEGKHWRSTRVHNGTIRVKTLNL